MPAYPELAHLIRANGQWAADVEKAEPGFFANSAKGQKPTILWIGCADSRAPESVVMAARPGEVFVHRNIANQVHPGDASAASVMYYAIHALGVRHVVIAGHTACGGAAACAAAAKAGSSGVVPDAGGETAAINQWLAPMVKLVGTLGSNPSLDEIVVANVKQQVKNAADSEPVKAAWAKGLDVHVHGWVYHLDKGTIEDLGVSVAPQKA